ncbi:racemase [Mangrovibacter phragmitis]|uniref:Racemase n=1 Tax=Mangrovibacter phragmitis TaxID=1691903 RepID=A0A1B7KYI2_9ENTR|nr:amino acid racemase [Mangrovibacter phragmitis]OAT75104.1 racemase [Mangrovibacter phragmitis]
MKTLGLIGGMSWESTLPYYQLLNEGVKARLGGLHSAKIVLHSVDFYEIEACQASGQWVKAGEILASAAQGLQAAGAQGIVLCTNTMHRVADQIESACTLPFLHIADATGRSIARAGIQRLGLLGTRYTMEQDFLTGRLAQNFGLACLVPPPEQRQNINRIIFDELCMGQITPEAKTAFLGAIEGLIARGAQGIILGCTEIGLLIKQEDVPLPVFDTTAIHVEDALGFMLADCPV